MNTSSRSTSLAQWPLGGIRNKPDSQATKDTKDTAFFAQKGLSFLVLDCVLVLVLGVLLELF